MKVTAGFAAAAALVSSVVASPGYSGDWTSTTSTTTTTTTTTTSTTTPTWDWTTTTTTSTTTTPGWTSADWATTVVTAVTTYCPEATMITHGGKTYTVTDATTLTITDCPCTISWPVWTSVSTDCSTTTTTTTTPVATTPAWGWSSTTTPVVAAATATWSSYTPAIPTYTGAANALVANVGAGLVGVAGLAALLL